jgi:ribosomal protein S6--L-glutamate ligase
MNLVVLSRNAKLYSTKRLVEAAQKRGHEIRVIDHSKCDLVIEKKKPKVLYRGEEITGVNAVIPRIGASVTFYGTAVVRQFEMMNVFTAVESQALVRSRDKLRSLQILSRAGLGLPKTVFTNYSKDVERTLKEVGGAPVIIKLLEGTQGLGVVLAENKKAAVSVIEAFNGLKARVIVQEFIKESRGEDIRAFVVDGGGTAKVIELTPEEEIAAIKAANAMKLGIAGVDMLRSERGPLIIEVNSSPGLEGIESATGVDIAGQIIKYIEKNV